MKNYHSHSKRCHHAVGNDREYVEKAIEAGYEEIGFSDHTPMTFPNDYYSNYRMSKEDTKGYIDSIKELQKGFAGKIKINIGFEVEYYPELFSNLLKFLSNYQYDYLIMGQHFVGNEYDRGSFYSGNTTRNPDKLQKYIDQALEGIKTKQFLYIAHPDLINFKGKKDVYKEKMTYFAKELKRLNCPVEFNMLGFKEGRNYPNKLFWQIVSEVGNDVIIGLDAHNPNAYLEKGYYEKALEFLKELNIVPLYGIDIDNYKRNR